MINSLLVLIASIIPRRSVLSLFELERRREKGDSSAAEELKREVLLEDVFSLRHAAEALLLVLAVITGVAVFGPLFGALIAVVIALVYGRVARFEFVHNLAQRIYEQYEHGVLNFVEHHPSVGKLIRTVTIPQNDAMICSREELEHAVENASAILTQNEIKMITNSLHFEERRVEEIMTPRGVITSIDKNEIIGPLTLHELHESGHSRFPVTDGDIDHVIGVLHVKDLLSLNDKKTQTAEGAMEPKVYYINQDQTLQHALAAFLKTRHHMFIVVNGYRETAGVVTLEDVIEALLGRKIVDEFDVHDDLRIVAERNAKSNNNSTHGTNV